MSEEFKDLGTPANQQKKALAKAASKASKKKVEYPHVFTEQDGKLLKITVKPNGAHSIFLAKKPKPGGETYHTKLAEYNNAIKSCKDQGKWVDGSSVDEHINKMITGA
jgi:hypothetical protein